jgi:hypothetical protein
VEPSSLVFVAIIGVWAAYLVPHWLRRRDDLAQSRTRDRFSGGLRVLQRRSRSVKTSHRSGDAVLTSPRVVVDADGEFLYIPADRALQARLDREKAAAAAARREASTAEPALAELADDEPVHELADTDDVPFVPGTVLARTTLTPEDVAAESAALAAPYVPSGRLRSGQIAKRAAPAAQADLTVQVDPSQHIETPVVVERLDQVGSQAASERSVHAAAVEHRAAKVTVAVEARTSRQPIPVAEREAAVIIGRPTARQHPTNQNGPASQRPTAQQPAATAHPVDRRRPAPGRASSVLAELDEAELTPPQSKEPVLLVDESDTPATARAAAARAGAVRSPIPLLERPHDLELARTGARIAARRRAVIMVLLFVATLASWGVVAGSAVPLWTAFPATGLLVVHMFASRIAGLRSRETLTLLSAQLHAAELALARAEQHPVAKARTAEAIVDALPTPALDRVARRAAAVGAETWEPVPVPPPTYTLKPAVHRPEPAPLPSIDVPAAQTGSAPAAVSRGALPRRAADVERILALESHLDELFEDRKAVNG